jgi:hypothetical protein
MPQRPKAEVEARVRDVEAAMLQYPWTYAVQDMLALKHGVSQRQIRLDAQKVRERWRIDTLDVDVDERRADWFQRLRTAQYKAEKNNQTIALSRLLALEAKAMGYEAPAIVEVKHSSADLDPYNQARAIVDAYDEAQRYINAVEQGERALLEDKS